MTRVFLFTTALMAGLTVPALAGTPPTTRNQSPEAVAAACAELGSKGQVVAFGTTTGCQNTSTGAAVTCDANGQCKDYFADPRYRKIKTILDSATKQQAPARL